MTKYLINEKDNTLYVETKALEKHRALRPATDAEVARILGEKVSAPEPEINEVPTEEEDEATADDEAEATVDEAGNADNVPLEDVHWQTLKKMVEEKGGTWTNKADGIAFLRVQ